MMNTVGGQGEAGSHDQQGGENILECAERREAPHLTSEGIARKSQLSKWKSRADICNHFCNIK